MRKDEQNKRKEQSIPRVILAMAVLCLMLVVSLEIAGHEHLDYDHHDCPVCLLGVLPFLGMAVFLFLVLWIRLDSLVPQGILFSKQLSSRLFSSRAPPSSI